MGVNTRAHAVLAAMVVGLMASIALGQPESILTLDPSRPGRPPFHKGDQLEIQSDAISSTAMRVTVLDPSNWPWVVVKTETGELWLNFNHVVTARNIVSAKAP
jgi:hypothetical protein